MLFLKISLGSSVSRLLFSALRERKKAWHAHWRYIMCYVVAAKQLQCTSKSLKVLIKIKLFSNIKTFIPFLKIKYMTKDEQLPVLGWAWTGATHRKWIWLPSLAMFVGNSGQTAIFETSISSRATFLYKEDIIASSTPSCAWTANQYTGLGAIISSKKHDMQLVWVFCHLQDFSRSGQDSTSGQDSARLNTVAISTLTRTKRFTKHYLKHQGFYFLPERLWYQDRSDDHPWRPLHEGSFYEHHLNDSSSRAQCMNRPLPSHRI